MKNTIICYKCKKEIKNLKKAIYVGKHIDTGKEIYKHDFVCTKGLNPNPFATRRVWGFNPRTRVKDDKPSRAKDKQKFVKELKEGH